VLWSAAGTCVVLQDAARDVWQAVGAAGPKVTYVHSEMDAGASWGEEYARISVLSKETKGVGTVENLRDVKGR
jgi:hypothetical protein